MDNLIYALNATLPVFLLMVCGMLFRKMGIMTPAFTEKANTYVFRVALPMSLFVQLSGISFLEVWDSGFLLFCLGATTLSVLLAALLSRALVRPEMRGEFVQVSYRSSASLVGMAFMENLYGSAAMGSLMILGSVPLYNMAAVLILSLMRPDRKKLEKAAVRKTLIGIVTNPIILGTLGGFLIAVLPFSMPEILKKTCSEIGKTATPIGLMAMGAQMECREAGKCVRETAWASFLKLIGFTMLFLPLAVLLGFRREELVAILVMLGSASTVAGYIMAKNMGYTGVLTQSAVMVTTLLSPVTLTFWLYMLRSMGFI